MKRLWFQIKPEMINKSLQLSNGFVYEETGDMVRLNTFKYQRLLDILSVVTDNIIIFYNFVEDREFLVKHLPNAVVYEGVKQEQDWNAGKIKNPYTISVFTKVWFKFTRWWSYYNLVWFGLVCWKVIHKQMPDFTDVGKRTMWTFTI